MKNKSVIFLIICLLIFVIIFFFAYTYLNKNKNNTLQNKVLETVLPETTKKRTLEKLNQTLEAANQNATTSTEATKQLQNALEAANAKSVIDGKNTNAENLEQELLKQANQDKERRELLKVLEQANR